ncbi:MAG: ribosomal protein L11 methyltransferase [Bacteroidetes bacterium]|nr:MAG: ribosomal protein L11 methyltransferase [Bacteroidota bacterium]
MDYIELDIKITPRIPAGDILMTELAESGFESFDETKEGLKAYIVAENFTEQALQPLTGWDQQLAQITYTRRTIPAQNWNSVWESQFEPVLVAGRCRIRAPFHEPDHGVEFDLLIEPRMSFGTGHHETTSLMVEKLLTMELAGKTLMDMGCGTGVLGILALRLGAAAAQGVDVEENAVENARENASRNNVDFPVEKGDQRLLEGRNFEVILANINKNVLLQSISRYAEALSEAGALAISGFFVTDEDELIAAAQASGLHIKDRNSRNNWSMLYFEKTRGV